MVNRLRNNDTVDAVTHLHIMHISTYDSLVCQASLLRFRRGSAGREELGSISHKLLPLSAAHQYNAELKEYPWSLKIYKRWKLVLTNLTTWFHSQLDEELQSLQKADEKQAVAALLSGL